MVDTQEDKRKARCSEKRSTIPELKMRRQEDHAFQAMPEPHSKNFSHKTNILPCAHTTKKPRKERGKVPDILMLMAQLYFHHNICISLLYSDIGGRRRKIQMGSRIFAVLER